MSTHNLCFEQKYEKYQSFLCENFQFLEVKFSVYLYRRVFVMQNRMREPCEIYLMISTKFLFTMCINNGWINRWLNM